MAEICISYNQHSGHPSRLANGQEKNSEKIVFQGQWKGDEFCEKSAKN